MSTSVAYASWLVGLRDAECASVFMQGLARRLKHRAQLTTDGHLAYLEAVKSAFAHVDYAMLIKPYGTPPEAETRENSVECIGAQAQRIQGNPAWEHLSTSSAERQNLTVRPAMRCFTRLTNCLQKGRESSAGSEPRFSHYKFRRIHKALRVTPAMEAKITRHVWALEAIVDLLE